MKRNKKVIARVTAAALAGAMIFCQSTSMVMAAETVSEKEEVVYAILDSEGKVTGVYVVNSFAGGDIVDYGDYGNVKNLTTTDEITVDGEKISFHTEEAKVYYQGDLKKNDIPWNIEIHYYMDGKEYTAEKIAGMSGKLKIDIDITQNTNCDESFWEGYALQASMALDGDKCTNITAEDATIANVGSTKQLSYIILPGKGAEIEVTADVTEFEMDAISINAMKLNMNFEMDTVELTDKVSEIQDAVSEFQDGAGELDDGAGEIQDGAKSLYDGTKELSSGAGQLNSGVASLNEGIGTIQNALNTLNGNSDTLTGSSAQVLTALQTIQSSLSNVSVDAGQLAQLSSASTQIKTGIDSLVGGLQTMNGSIDNYYARLSAAGISDINAYIASHDTAIGALNTVINTYGLSGVGLESVVGLLEGDRAYIQGSEALISGIDASLDSQNGQLMTGALALQQNYMVFDANIQSMVQSLGALTQDMATLKSGIDTLTANYKNLDTGINEYTAAVAEITKGYEAVYQGALSIASGTSDLYSGTKEMVDGALELYNGTGDLKDGTEELTDGTNEFYDKTKDMDTEISDTIDDKIDELTGKNIETKSFVSDKNTNIDSVLFVIKTPAIEIPEVEQTVVEEEEEPGMWQKFLNLF